MPANTAAKALPYPLPTDRVADGAEAIRKLAQSVDNMIQGSYQMLPITAAATAAEITWTFPIPYAAGTTPIILVSVAFFPADGTVSASAGHVVYADSITNASVRLRGQRTNGTAPFRVSVIAIGVVTPVA